LKNRIQKSEVRRQKERKSVMIKSKLIIVLSLLFVLSLDGEALAGKTNRSPALHPDGIPAAGQQHRKRRVRRKQRIRRAGSYGIKAMPEQPPTPSAEPNTGGAPPPPPPPPPPAAEEMPVKAAPAPPPADPMDAPGRGRAKKGAPKIKPPTVQIKPPTK
jgi:hypothetical protein